MTFVSYAQNYEDVMLFRALKEVGRGFYIDVGAGDPVADSVTKAFYDRGWRGINIEPVEQWFQRLRVDRPEDINLRLAVAAEAGDVRFFDVPETGMSTMNAAVARQHSVQGLPVRECTVPAKPLDTICAECGVREVHFLKVDVEGAETEVFRGTSLREIRPWIIVVESTAPNSQISTHAEWEHLLTSWGYEFVYFDGLNRFYVARERPALKDAFTLPPNYFDQFIRYSEWQARERASQLEAELNALRQEKDGLQSSLLEVRRTVEDMHRSLSLRITAPLRAVKRWLPLTTHRLRRACSDVAHTPRRALRALGWQAWSHSAVRVVARRLLGRWPRLSWRVKRFVLMTPEEGVQQHRAESFGPTIVNNRLARHASRSTGSSSDHDTPAGHGRFLVIESKQAVVDVEALRRRLWRKRND